MADKKYETIKIEREGGITFVIFNRPDQRNAMSPQLHMDMQDALEDLAIDPKTEVLVITGAGKAFSAGQDIKLYFRGTATDPAARHKARLASNNWRWQQLSRFPKPTIAMVNGFCFGGAFTQVSACDFAFAADDAIFGLSEVNWGILPGGIVAFDDTVDMAKQARYAMQFCANESCGKCTPCRIGSTRGVEVIDRIRAGQHEQIQLLRSLCDTMTHGSMCAMGGMTPYPVLSALNHFPEDFE